VRSARILNRLRSLVGQILSILSVIATTASPVLSKTPGEVHCYHVTCHRVLTIAETQSLIGSTRILVASYYDDPRVDRFNTGELTSSGERFDANNSARAASSIFPDGTELLVWNPLNGRAAHVRINDFGPFHSNRTLDVTEALAKHLDITRKGVIALLVTVVAPPPSSEPVYRSFRTYPKTKGYLGIYVEEALAGLAKRLTAESLGRNETKFAEPMVAANIPLPQPKPLPRFGPRDTIRAANPPSERLFDVLQPRSLRSQPPMETAVLLTPALAPAVDLQPALVIASDPDAYGDAAELGFERLSFATHSAVTPARTEVWSDETGAPPKRLTLNTLFCLIAASMGMIFLQRLNRSSIIATSAGRTRGLIDSPFQASEELARPPPHKAVFVVEPRARSSIIGRELQISGCLIATSDVTIEGRIDGDCVCRQLIIKPTGKLTGDVIAEEVLVEGSLRGRILAKTVGLASRAVVIGDVAYCDLIVERRGTLEATVRRISREAWVISGEENSVDQALAASR
jgi:rare lipoprotein A (peptidoglycan hydrolase)/cytoskeletal protein CcmA (bactofilin family)